MLDDPALRRRAPPSARAGRRSGRRGRRAGGRARDARGGSRTRPASRARPRPRPSWSPLRLCVRLVSSSWSKVQVQVSLKSRPDRDSIPRAQLLTISETSRRSGVASSALRYYEERGLISAEREGSGHRRYPRPVLRRIAFIVFAQKVGLSLEEIAAELAKLPPQAPRPQGLVAPLRHLERPHRRADRRAGAPQGGPHRVHRLRLPLARPLQARQPRRPRRRPRLRPPLLAGRSAARPDGLIRKRLTIQTQMLQVAPPAGSPSPCKRPGRRRSTPRRAFAGPAEGAAPGVRPRRSARRPRPGRRRGHRGRPVPEPHQRSRGRRLGARREQHPARRRTRPRLGLGRGRRDLRRGCRRRHDHRPDGRPRAPRPRAEHGRGLYIANQLCDEVSIDSSATGTRIRLRMDVAAAPTAARLDPAQREQDDVVPQLAAGCG